MEPSAAFQSILPAGLLHFSGDGYGNAVGRPEGYEHNADGGEQDIRWLFLWEALCISSIGGCLGAALGLLIGGLACLLLGLSFEPLLLPIGLALAASTLIGLLFGIAPANRAAKVSLLLANGFQALNSSSALVVEPVKECN